MGRWIIAAWALGGCTEPPEALCVAGDVGGACADHGADGARVVAGGSLGLAYSVTSHQLRFQVYGATPGATVGVGGSAGGLGQGPCPGGLGGLCVDLLPPLRIVGQATADAQGRASFVLQRKPPPGTAFQAVQLGAAPAVSAPFVYETLACDVFPPNNPWNTDISGFPVHPNSDDFIDSIGRGTGLHADFGTVWAGAPNGIPYVEVTGMQPRVDIDFDYANQSDPGPYPIPPDAPIEGGPNGNGDRHILVLDRDRCELWETWNTWPNGDGTWWAGSGAWFDLSSNQLRPDYWTSADAAGLPIYPALVRYDEVVLEGVIDHALRFTVSETQRGFIHPATHFASNCTVQSCPDDPPMGLRVRMKAGYSCAGLSSEVRVICTALKKYGMFVADNGSDWYVSGAPDPRWSDNALADIGEIPGDAFEVVFTGQVIE